MVIQKLERLSRTYWQHSKSNCLKTLPTGGTHAEGSSNVKGGQSRTALSAVGSRWSPAWKWRRRPAQQTQQTLNRPTIIFPERGQNNVPVPEECSLFACGPFSPALYPTAQSPVWPVWQSCAGTATQNLKLQNQRTLWPRVWVLWVIIYLKQTSSRKQSSHTKLHSSPDLHFWQKLHLSNHKRSFIGT